MASQLIPKVAEFSFYGRAGNYSITTVVKRNRHPVVRILRGRSAERRNAEQRDHHAVNHCHVALDALLASFLIMY